MLYPLDLARNTDGGHISERLAYRVGGVCGLVLGLAYLVIIALYAPIGAPPVSVDGLLPYLARSSTRWSWIIGLSVMTDFLFVPLALSIYFALRKVNSYTACLAAACVILFVLLDLAITWTNYASLMTLASAYRSTVTEAERTAILTMATPAAALLHSNLLFVYNTLTLAVGILLSGIIMLRSTFGKSTAYLGVATGCAGILSVIGPFFASALQNAIIVASSLTALWLFIVGYQFCRMAARTPSDVPLSS